MVKLLQKGVIIYALIPKMDCSIFANVVALMLKYMFFINFVSWNSLQKSSKNWFFILFGVRSGEMAESAPCFHCTVRMKKLNIKAIVFSNSDGELEKRRINEYDTDKLTYGAKRVIDPSFYIR